jgi:hypothetical protein
LGRPYADTLKGSKRIANLKELRAKPRLMCSGLPIFLILNGKVCC